MQTPDKHANSAGWIGLAIGYALLLIVAAGSAAMFGVPGWTGGTSPSQQQTSYAPQPTNEMRGGGTRQNTTGYGSKDSQ